jgi:hypothetical protein
MEDWIAFEWTRDVLDDVRCRLKEGAKGAGTILSADESEKVPKWLADPSQPVGAPPDVDIFVRNHAIHRRYRELRKRGLSSAQAICETAKRYGVSKWVVRRNVAEL